MNTENKPRVSPTECRYQGRQLLELLLRGTTITLICKKQTIKVKLDAPNTTKHGIQKMIIRKFPANTQSKKAASALNLANLILHNQPTEIKTENNEKINQNIQ